MIPEIVPRENVARANGILNMTTNIAIIIGMLVAGTLSDHLKQKAGVLHAWMPGIVLTSVSVVGLAAIVWLPKLFPINSHAKPPLNPFTTYIATGREMCRSILMKVSIAWAFFYLLATIVLLLVNELAPVLQVSDTKVSYLLASIGVSVGIGSMTAGFLSRENIRLVLSKYAAIGMAASVLFAGLMPITYGSVLFGLICLGFTAGLYAIPLQTIMQMLPAAENRGQVLATSNAISFLLMAGGSLLYKLFRPLFGDSPQYIFVVCAGIGILAFLVTLTIHLPSESNDTMKRL
jgi:acyl-[acyl-carrier-protein]-phospholipid O-acyltransferase/long-chain-fatty-acid--[acyl-carrier-protein] ligase